MSDPSNSAPSESGAGLTYWNVPETLAEAFPQLHEQIGAALRCDREHGQRPQPHAYLESFFLRLLVAACSDPDRSDLARRASQFLETLLENPDDDLVSATLLNVVQPVVSTPEWFAAVAPFLGPRATEWAEIASALE